MYWGEERGEVRADQIDITMGGSDSGVPKTRRVLLSLYCICSHDLRSLDEIYLYQYLLKLVFGVTSFARLLRSVIFYSCGSLDVGSLSKKT
jgi:hypothetical protein